MPISLQVIGALGGASKQAVSHGRDPKRWLQAAIRRNLVGKTALDQAFYTEEIRRQSRLRTTEMLEAARQRLSALPVPLSGTGKAGAPVRRNPEALAALLGVSSPSGGESLLQVFARFVALCLRTLYRDVLPRVATKSLWGSDLLLLLDSYWLPRHRLRLIPVS